MGKKRKKTKKTKNRVAREVNLVFREKHMDGFPPGYGFDEFIGDALAVFAIDAWQREELKNLDIAEIKLPNKDKTVLVYFTNGDKQVAVCSDEDEFSIEAGISICIAKEFCSYLYGGPGKFGKLLDRAEELLGQPESEKEVRDARE